MSTMFPSPVSLVIGFFTNFAAGCFGRALIFIKSRAEREHEFSYDFIGLSHEHGCGHGSPCWQPPRIGRLH